MDDVYYAQALVMWLNNTTLLDSNNRCRHMQFWGLYEGCLSKPN